LRKTLSERESLEIAGGATPRRFARLSPSQLRRIRDKAQSPLAIDRFHTVTYGKINAGKRL
jgi:hypothetical protein